MKRYNLEFQPDGVRMAQYPYGEWVRYEDAEARIYELEQWIREIGNFSLVPEIVQLSAKMIVK